MSAQDEMDRVIADLERQVDRLKAIRAQQLMQVTASPRVVAGPLRLWSEPGPEVGGSVGSGPQVDHKENVSPRCGVLTHPTCGIPCATCDDDGRPDAA